MKVNKYQWGGYSPILTENVSKSPKQMVSDVKTVAQLVGWPGWNTAAYTYEAINKPNEDRRNAALISGVGNLAAATMIPYAWPLGLLTLGLSNGAALGLKDLADQESLNQEDSITSNRRKAADDLNENNSSKNNNKIVKDQEPTGPISYSTTPFNRYQSLKSPITGNPIEVKTDNTLWSWYRGKNPWKYINGGTRYRKGENGWEIQKFDGGGGYIDYSDPSDIEYWTNYVTELEKVLPNVPRKNVFGVTRKNQNGGLLMRKGGKIIEVPFALVN